MIRQTSSPCSETDPETRCFRHFLDPIDGVMCVPAESTADTIEQQTRQQQLRFPLWLDTSTTLTQQLQSAEFAPASSRFGPFCDNVLGMNWRLPDGRMLRLGERVVKTTTGYDVFRFLLHSDGRYGSATDYVLRLRPDCGTAVTFLLTGPPECLATAIAVLLRGTWLSWFDSLDVMVEGEICRLRIHVHCPQEETALFTDYLTEFVRCQQLILATEAAGSVPADGLPDVFVKTTPDRVFAMSRRLSESSGGRVCGLCSSGVVNVYLPKERFVTQCNADVENSTYGTPPQETLSLAHSIRSIVQPLVAELQSCGGHWHSRHIPVPDAQPPESDWIAVLQKEAGLL